MADQASRFNFGPTRWSLLGGVKQQGAEGDRARNELLERYHVAVNRYLLARLGDANAVDEVYALYVDRVTQNHPFLERVDKEKGKFRHYLRRILQNLVYDHYRAKKTPQVAFEESAFVAPPMTDEEEEQFRREWENELLRHTWHRLEETSRAKGQLHFDLMSYKAQNPASRSQEIAEHFSRPGKPLTKENVRQLLHRGQDLLHDLLLEEVANSLEKRLGEAASADQVEEELQDLRMLNTSCRAALERLRGKKK